MSVRPSSPGSITSTMATSGRRLERQREPALAVAGHIHREAGLAKASGDEVRDGRVVFDDEGLS